MKTAFSILSLLIAIGVAVFSVYQYEELRKVKHNTEAAIHHLNVNVAENLARLQKATLEVEQESKKAARITAVEDYASREVEFLIRMAAERLIVNYDVQNAIKLLDAADNSLQALNNPSLKPLRETLAENRLALQSIKLPDLEGLWLTISAIEEQLPSLPTRGVRAGPQASLNETSSNNTSSDETQKQKESITEQQKNKDTSWKDSLYQTWGEVKDLVKIRKHSKPLEPILSSTEQLLAKEQLQLALEQMKWALLQRNNAIYQQTIKEAVLLLNTHFESTDERVKNIENQLKKIAEVNLKPTLPDLNKTLELFQTKR